MRAAPFLEAQWRHIAMLNYEADRSVLAPLVPRGTELDDWQGRTYLSVVGFLFLGTRVLGVRLPGRGFGGDGVARNPPCRLRAWKLRLPRPANARP